MLSYCKVGKVGYACDADTGIVTPSPAERGEPKLPAQRVLSHNPRVFSTDDPAPRPAYLRDWRENCHIRQFSGPASLSQPRNLTSWPVYSGTEQDFTNHCVGDEIFLFIL